MMVFRHMDWTVGRTLQVLEVKYLADALGRFLRHIAERTRLRGQDHSEGWDPKCSSARCEKTWLVTACP